MTSTSVDLRTKPKRIRNDKAKRSARQNEINLKKRQQQLAAAGVPEAYVKGARLAQAGLMPTEAKYITPKDLYVASTEKEPGILKIGQVLGISPRHLSALRLQDCLYLGKCGQLSMGESYGTICTWRCSH